MNDFFEDGNIIKRETEKELYIGLRDGYLISEDVYNTMVGDDKFLYWKKIINEMDKSNISKDTYYRKKTISIDETNENSLMLSENIMFDSIIYDEKTDVEMLLLKFYKVEKITIIQQKRFELFYLESKNITEIAEIEGVTKQSVFQSIKSVTKKVKSFFSKKNTKNIW